LFTHYNYFDLKIWKFGDLKMRATHHSFQISKSSNYQIVLHFFKLSNCSPFPNLQISKFSNQARDALIISANTPEAVTSAPAPAPLITKG
jgi:hypothetical protein